MAPDCYKVDFLHFENPHLMWVKINAAAAGLSKYDEYVVEQIGLYGLMPSELTLDLVEGKSTTNSCENWVPGASVLIKDFILGGVEIFFAPTFIDRRHSILEDNIHKYGDLIITRPNGRRKSLIKLLVKSGFAVNDDCTFHLHLSSNKLKTKLSKEMIEEVIDKIAEACVRGKGLKSSSKVSKERLIRPVKPSDSALTEENVKAVNEKSKDVTCVEYLRKKKVAAKFNLGDNGTGNTKDEIRACSKENKGYILKKKMQLKDEILSKGPIAKFEATKLFLSTNAQFVPKLNKSYDDVEFIPKLNKSCDEDKVTEAPTKLQILPKDRMDGEICEVATQKFKKPKAAKSPKATNKVPEYDIATEMRVGYGPPDADRSLFSLKIVPKGDLDDTFVALTNKDERIDESLPKKHDDYGDVDSDIEIEFPEQHKEEGLVKDLEVNTKIQDLNIEMPKQYENDETRIKIQELNSSHFETSKKASPGSALKKKLRLHEKLLSKNQGSSHTSSVSENSIKRSSVIIEEVKSKLSPKKQELDSDDDDDTISDIIDKINAEYPVKDVVKVDAPTQNYVQTKHHVNPFKNIDPKISVFVEKLITPVLMVHTRNNSRIRPNSELRDIPFSSHIHVALKSMSIEEPMMLQTVSWAAILRGCSLFMVSPKGSGKTMGYLPAVCRLVSDGNPDMRGKGPICIIVCATANSVSEIGKQAQKFLRHTDKVFACYPGMDELKLTTSLLNGCDLLICTPSLLVRLMRSTDFGVDLRRLTTFVLDDCERLSEVYINEIKYFHHKIKEMYKNRAAKEAEVQYILASRVWCEFMEPLASKVPNTVISIGAFQECVLYAKTNMTASFTSKDKKVNSVLEFLKEIDVTKKIVIVCRFDHEVRTLESALTNAKYAVFSCNSSMTVQDLYNVSMAWDEQDPRCGSILVCCDGNLTHMNITNAYYLIHYSLPHLFSLFCKRFSVLNDNYASIFKDQNDDVKIKILLEDGNVEQLPKILHFIKRCTNDVPAALDDVCEKVLAERDSSKAKQLVPVCDNLLALGECPDFWNCHERHAIFKEYDEPKDWMPPKGVVTFKILHYHNAALYSARLIGYSANGLTIGYAQKYTMLSMKMATYYAKESNRKLHGVPVVGDICAVSLRQNFFVRCQVVKILNRYQNGKPNYVLIKLIDEESYEQTRDVDLYHLPDEDKFVDTHVVRVRLSSIQPKDKDITFSEHAKEHLKNITDNNDKLYMRGEITFVIGNCVFVDSLEACTDLPSLNKTVVRYNFREELKDHSSHNPEHIAKLIKLCSDGGLTVNQEKQKIEDAKPLQELPKGQWAHLEKDDLSSIFFTFAEDPGMFFIRLAKFEDCMDRLIKDIQKYMTDKPGAVTDISKGDIVLAKFPDDGIYERARIDDIYMNNVKCFFVDHGDWRDVGKADLAQITEKFITQLPFQAIECRLMGVTPPSEDWTEFSINWFVNCFSDHTGALKQLYAKYFAKEKAQYTEGHKYAIALIDTTTEEDLIINLSMIDMNLARENYIETELFANLDFKRTLVEVQSSDDDAEWEKVANNKIPDDILQHDAPKNVDVVATLNNPIRSVPLVDSDCESDDMDFNVTDEFMALFQPTTKVQQLNTNLPAIKSQTTEFPVCKILDDQIGSGDTSIGSSICVLQTPPPKILELDSDDFTGSDITLLSNDTPEKLPLVTEIKSIGTKVEVRKPKLCWRQTTNNVYVKILLIGVEAYELEMKDKYLKFEATLDDVKYGFEFETYGVYDSVKCTHENKGQYILVNMKKILNKTWLSLSKGIQRYIVYDADYIEESSEEESVPELGITSALKYMNESESESDDEFMDDAMFTINVK